MDPLKTPSSSPDDEEKSTSTDEPQGVPPVEKSGSAPTEEASASDSEASEETAPESSESDAGKDASSDTEGDKVAMSTSDSGPSLASEASDSSSDSSSESSKPDSAAPASDSGSDTAPAVTDSTPPTVTAPVVDGDAASGQPPAGLGGVAPAPKSRKKKMILGVLVAVLVVLLGGAAAAYQYILTKPENVLKMALSNTLSDKVKTVHFDGEFNVTEDKNNQSFGATFTGASDESGAFDVTAKVDAYVTNITVDMRSVDGKTLYARVGGLEGLPELLASSTSPEVAQMYAPMISAVNNQWLEINESLIKQFTGAKDTTLSNADMLKLKEAYEKHPFLVVKEALANEKVKGVDSYHYKVVIDKTELKSFVAAVKDANIDSLKLTKEQVDSFNDSVKDAKFEKYPVDVWISKGDKLINQISFKMSEGGATGTFRFTVDSFNKPVKVEKPEGAKSILDVLGSFYGGLSGASSGALDSSTLMQEMEGGSGISL